MTIYRMILFNPATKQRNISKLSIKMYDRKHQTIRPTLNTNKLNLPQKRTAANTSYYKVIKRLPQISSCSTLKFLSWDKILPSPLLPINNFKFSDFCDLKFISFGGFSEVYSATNVYSRKQYAIKVVNKQSTDQKSLNNVRKEIDIQKSLINPFITRCYGSWETEDCVCIVLELADGDLFQLWKENKVFSESIVQTYLKSLARAIDFMHKNNVMFRDVKLENILIKDGKLKFADFGLAKRIALGSIALTKCGTMEYMAPEMLAGKCYSHSIDYWGLGVALYAISTGHYPYSACDTYMKMYQKITDGCQLVFPEHLNKNLVSLITDLLAVNPSLRISSLKEILSHPFCKGLNGTSEPEYAIEESHSELCTNRNNINEAALFV